MTKLYDLACQAAELTQDQTLASAARQLAGGGKLRLSFIDTRDANARRVIAKLPQTEEAMNPLWFDAAFGMDADSPQILGGDLCILVLDATQLLSQRERELIGDVLIPCFGAKKLLLVLSRLEQVPPEEYGEVHAHLRAALDGDDMLILRAEELAAYLTDDLPARRAELLRATEETIRAFALAAGEKKLAELALMRRLHEEGRLATQQRLAELDETYQGLHDRAVHRGQAFARGARMQLTQEINAYAVQVKTTVREELTKAQDLAAAQRHISGYLSYLWDTFLKDTQAQWQYLLVDYAQEAQSRMEADMAELTASLGGVTADLLSMVITDQIDHYPTKVFIGKNAGQGEGFEKVFGTGVTGLSKAMTVASGILLLVNLPVALGTFAASHLVKVVFKDQVGEEKRSALTASIMGACDTLSASIQSENAQSMDRLEGGIKTHIASAYENAFDSLKARLEESGKETGLEQQREALQAIVDELTAFGW